MELSPRQCVPRPAPASPCPAQTATGSCCPVALLPCAFLHLCRQCDLKLPPPIPQADTNLGKFLDYCTYGHMIDNVILIVTGTLHERDVQARYPRPELASRCCAVLLMPPKGQA